MAPDIDEEELSERLRAHATRRFLPLESPCRSARLRNPLCGDEVQFSVQEVDGRVSEASCESKGCFACKVAASVVCDELRGRSVEESLKELREFREIFLGREGTVSDELSLLLTFRGYPARVKCILLSVDVVEQLAKQPSEGVL